MPASTIYDIDIGQGSNAIDMAYVIGQNNLNDGLADYFNNLGVTIAWGFDISGSSLVPPADPDNPNISFVGVIAAPASTAIPIIDLSQSSTAQQVGFNLTFLSATFTDNFDKLPPYVQGADQWVLPFLGTLNQIQPEPSDQPGWLAAQIAGLNAQYGDGIFAVNQVVVDLGALEINSNLQSAYQPAAFSGVVGAGEWSFLLKGMAQYVSANAATIFSALPGMGYAVTAGPGGANLPTYTPTAAQFVIVPNAATPGYSALVWALMAGDPMPDNPAENFANAQLIADDQTTGYAIIGGSKFLKFLQVELATVTDALGAAQFIQASGEATWSEGALSDPGMLALTAPSAANGFQLANWTMPTQSTEGRYEPFGGGSYYSYATGNSALSVALAANNIDNGCFNSIVASGTIASSVSYNSNEQGNDAGWSSPTFQWNWSGRFDMEIDASQIGVEFVFDKTAWVFPTTPVLVGSGDGFGTVQPSTQQLLTSMLSTPISQMSANLQAGLISGLGNLGAFVFAGGGVFTFQNPMVNQTYALVTALEFQAPA